MEKIKGDKTPVDVKLIVSWGLLRPRFKDREVTDSEYRWLIEEGYYHIFGGLLMRTPKTPNMDIDDLEVGIKLLKWEILR